MDRRWPLSLPLVLVAAAAAFLVGLDWGLPSRAADPYLFGDEPVWPGQKILALGGGWDADAERGADVAQNPLAASDRPVDVNATDVERARILRRYRLSSYQPDEMITFRALASMDPRRLHFDPKLYQYGGLWIYPVAAMLKAAATLHLLVLRSDVAWYLDHPDAFGRFYVVARLYSVLWGLAGVAAAYAVVRRICGGGDAAGDGGWIAPAAAAMCFALMPVVVTAAHEAKPHVAGAALILLAVLAASRYVERGTWAAAMAAGGLCGAAVGMVLWAYPVFLVLAAMALLRPEDIRRRLGVVAGAGLAGLGVYLSTNPYVGINLVAHRELLHSNLANTSAMYHVAPAGGLPLTNAARLVAAGASPLLAAAGAAGALGLAVRALRVRRSREASEVRRRATGLLLAVPAAAIAVPFVLLAAGKPGEYGRFAIVPDIFLAVEAVVAAATFLPRGAVRAAALGVLVVSTAVPGVISVRGFVRDASGRTSRLAEAERLRGLNRAGARTLAVFAEPAPYCLPPVDLFRWRVLLMPRGSGPQGGLGVADVFVRPVDVREDGFGCCAAARAAGVLTATPLSWADKPFEVRARGR